MLSPRFDVVSLADLTPDAGGWAIIDSWKGRNVIGSQPCTKRKDEATGTRVEG
jgi:hypothetical protein